MSEPRIPRMIWNDDGNGKLIERDNIEIKSPYAMINIGHLSGYLIEFNKVGFKIDAFSYNIRFDKRGR